MPDLPPYPGPPRWVKLFGIIAIVLVLLIVILVATGHHGPGRHHLGDGAGTTPAELS